MFWQNKQPRMLHPDKGLNSCRLTHASVAAITLPDCRNSLSGKTFSGKTSNQECCFQARLATKNAAFRQETWADLSFNGGHI